jgi:hypothetical protein
LDPGACAYRSDNVSLKQKIFGEGSETAAALDVSLSATPAERKACHELAAAAVLIAVIFALMVVSSTFIASRFSKT